MSSCRPIILFLLLTALATGSAIAQEKRVPFDSTGRVEEIDDDLEAKLMLFPQYTGFKWAKLYSLADSTHALDIRHTTPGFTVVTRTILSPAEVADLRARVNAERAKLFPDSLQAIDDFSDSVRDGRQILIAGTTLNALCLYGITLPLALDVDATVAIPIYAGTAVAGYLIPKLLTRNGSVDPGAARFAVDGALVGFLQGGTINTILHGREATFEGSMGWGVGMSIATEVGGYYLGKHMKMEEGQAEVTAIGGMFGIGVGTGIAAIAGFYVPGKMGTAAAIALVGSELGYVGGYMLGGSAHYTVGDARVLFATGVLGAYIPLTVVALTHVDAPAVALVAPLAGSVLGLGLGHILVREKDFSLWQGSMVTVGTVGGIVTGFLAGLTFTSEGRDYSRLYGAVAGSVIGGIVGYTIPMISYSGSSADGKTGSLINVRLAPEGAMALALRDRLHLPEGSSSPLLQVNGSF